MNIFPLFFGLFFTFTSDRPLKTNDCFYDWEQRLTEVKEYASSSLQWTATYTYDPLGNLVKKVKGGTTTTYVQDLNGGLPQILIEDDGATVAKYTYGGDRLKVSRSGDYYYFYDALGSTRTITNTSGTVICRYVYDVYGKPLDSECNEAQTWNNFKFTGELYDEDTDLLYLRARWYDPGTGRFLSRDTIEDRDYKYCKDDPVNCIDPSGHDGTLVGLMVSTSIANSLQAIYDSVVVNTGSALRHTIIGVFSGKDAEHIVHGYLNEVAMEFIAVIGIGVVIKLFKSLKNLKFGVNVSRRSGCPNSFNHLDVEVNIPSKTKSAGQFGSAGDDVRDIFEDISEARDATVAKGKTEGVGDFGTDMHTELANRIRARGGGLHAEVSYKDHIEVGYGTKDGVRLDVVIGPKEAPEAVLDLKTGTAKLDQARVNQIRSHLPEDCQDIPIIRVGADGSTIEW